MKVAVLIAFDGRDGRAWCCLYAAPSRFFALQGLMPRAITKERCSPSWRPEALCLGESTKEGGGACGARGLSGGR